MGQETVTIGDDFTARQELELYMNKLIGRIEAGAAAAALTKLDEQVYELGIDPALDAVHDLIEALRLESSDVAPTG